MGRLTQRWLKAQIELDKEMDGVEQALGFSNLDTEVYGVGQKIWSLVFGLDGGKRAEFRSLG
jgi:hypothetical protein